MFGALNLWIVRPAAFTSEHSNPVLCPHLAHTQACSSHLAINVWAS